MERISICAECGAPLEKTALINLVMSYEEDEDRGDVFEQLWHKACYDDFRQRLHVAFKAMLNSNQEHSPPGSYKQAAGLIPSQPGDEPAEVIIRKLRNATG